MSGRTTYDLITAALASENINDGVQALNVKTAPFLAWLLEGGGYKPSGNITHGYVENFMLPNYITVSTAVNSATAATGITINGLGTALTVGTILENEGATPELMQVTSIPGPNSILVARAYDAGTTGSLVVGGTLRVRVAAGVEGSDHSGEHTARLGTVKYNTVGYFKIPLAASGSQLEQGVLGAHAFADAEANAMRELPFQLETEIVRGKLNGANSLGTTTTTRTMKGIRAHLTSVNSSVASSAASFTANPHLYLGNLFQACWINGASQTETWGIVAGDQFFRDISNLNDTKVYDSQNVEGFKRVVRQYTGPFGAAEVFLSRGLLSKELLLIPRERVRPVQFRPWRRQVMGQQGDNVKVQLVGEYSVEVHHEAGIGRYVATS
jgi:hypothetical protein